MIIILGSLESA